VDDVILDVISFDWIIFYEVINVLFGLLLVPIHDPAYFEHVLAPEDSHTFKEVKVEGTALRKHG
jgi:hypothetical protein